MVDLPHAIWQELASLKQWVAWEENTKRPLDPRTLKGFKDLTPDILAILEDVKGDRVGFYAFADDPYILLDLDDVRDPATGKIVDWAMALVRLLDSYTEISPSGTGLHIIIRCHGKPSEGYIIRKAGGAKIEIRCNTQYITITGDLIHGIDGIKEHPPEILAHALFRPGDGSDQRKTGEKQSAGRQHVELAIVVGADRTLSYDDLLLLQENHPDFWMFWEKRTSPARDATHSGYMASLARRLANLGKDDQFIADALVCYCKKHKRPDAIDRRQFERCINLGRSPGKPDEKPENLQIEIEAIKEDEDLDEAEDRRAEQLRIVSDHFKMEISDIRKFGRNPGKVQFRNCQDWLDIGTPGEILNNQNQVLAALYAYNGQGVDRVKAPRWTRICTIIGRCWREEDAGDEERTTAIEELIEAQIHGIESQKVKDDDVPAAAREMRLHHDWRGERYVFAPTLMAEARLIGVRNIHETLRASGYEARTIKARGTTRTAWVRKL